MLLEDMEYTQAEVSCRMQFSAVQMSEFSYVCFSLNLVYFSEVFLTRSH